MYCRLKCIANSGPLGERFGELSDEAIDILAAGRVSSADYERIVNECGGRPEAVNAAILAAAR